MKNKQQTKGKEYNQAEDWPPRTQKDKKHPKLMPKTSLTQSESPDF